MAKRLAKGGFHHPTANSSVSTTNSTSTSTSGPDTHQSLSSADAAVATAAPGTAISSSPSRPIANGSGPSSILTDGQPLPRLIVFDLDYTLWPFWVDTHVVPPIKAAPSATSHSSSAATDKIGDVFAFYPDVPRMLYTLPQAGVRLAVASRTQTPDLARDMLKILHVPPPPPSGAGGAGGGGLTKPGRARRALDFFEAGLEMYPSSKIRHFEAIQKRTGAAYNEMLFFDDEARNRDVEQALGVLFCHVKDGMTWAELERGVREWRRRRWDGPGLRN